jgi:hypothetical protein
MRWFEVDDFGAGCFGVLAIGVGLSLMTVGAWLLLNA